MPCFVSGTLISTPRGDIAIEDLSADDLVLTRDNGFQAIKWCGARKLSHKSLAFTPALLPIKISAGALGPELPCTDLFVSPQHRVLLSSKISERMFNKPEVLVAAKHLLELEGLQTATQETSVTYHHLLFDTHQIVKSNGMWTESLLPARQALRSLPAASVQEIFILFPELKGIDCTPEPARETIPGRRARHLVSRHVKNNHSLASQL